MILITLALGATLTSRCSAFTGVLFLPPPSETLVEGCCALLKVSLKGSPTRVAAQAQAEGSVSGAARNVLNVRRP